MMVRGPLERLLAPRSLAFVGGRPAEIAIEQCRALGFEGDLWPVHPTRAEVCGLPAFPSVDDLPGVPDAVLVAVNRVATVEVVARLAAMDAGAAVCYASGFAEVGDEGVALQEALVAAAGDMPLVGPNCYGTLSATTGAALWPDQQGLSRTGKGIALVTQSGNIGLNLTMQTRPMAIAHLLTLGNQAMVGIEDCVEALAADGSVTAIGLHIEALHDVGRFSAACAVAAARRLPIVALKTGTSSTGAAIAVSHTGSMVGSDSAYGTLFERLGIHRVRSIPEFLDTLHVLDSVGPLPGNRLVSLSCSGGEASIVADRAEALDLAFAAFDAGQAERIAGTLSEFVAISNPLDYHTFIWDDEERLSGCFTAALDGPSDAAMLVLDFPSEGLDDSSWWPTLQAFGAAARGTGTPGLVVGSMAENLPAAVEAAAVELGLVPVRGIDAALLGLEAAARWGRHVPSGIPDPVRRSTGGLRVLQEDEAKRLLVAAGIPVPVGEEVEATRAVDAADRIGFPVVVKATGVAHKSDVGGVVLDLGDGSAVAEAAGRMGGTVLVEQHVGDVVAELLVDVRREPPVGWLLTLGAGGTLVELVRDTVSLLLPVEADDVRRALGGLGIARLLAGHRGRPPADIDAIIEVVEHLQRLLYEHPELVEVEINPLLARPSGAVVADALITVERGGA
ncbi:MAG: acetate--CoA ligase family protein [Actinomycetia bacterium]|nr:acetate--CoA ligase family protein [Actinomycetes bacterium]